MIIEANNAKAITPNQWTLLVVFNMIFMNEPIISITPSVKIKVIDIPPLCIRL